MARIVGLALFAAALTGTAAGLAHADLLPALRTDRPVTVYLHRDGVDLRGGTDDPRRRRSDLVAASGKSSVSVPAFTGNDAVWTEFVGCVEDQFSDFSVVVVDEPPRSGDYVMVAVGGAPELIGRDSTVRGLAPYNGTVLRDAVAFVFEPEGAGPRDLCETAAEEIGHAMGLDHSRLCSDVMSYGDCGPKSFEDVHASCGEWSDRECTDDAETQNSWRHLAKNVGLRDEEAPSNRIASRGMPALSLASEKASRAIVACECAN